MKYVCLFILFSIISISSANDFEEQLVDTWSFNYIGLNGNSVMGYTVYDKDHTFHTAVIQTLEGKYHIPVAASGTWSVNGSILTLEVTYSSNLKMYPSNLKISADIIEFNDDEYRYVSSDGTIKHETRVKLPVR